jgi:hypothetical protein
MCSSWIKINISWVLYSHDLEIMFISHIPTSSAYGVYILQLIHYARVCSSYDQILVWGSLLTNKLMSQVFQMSLLQSALRTFYGCYNNPICPYNLLMATCCPICFMTIVWTFLTLILTTVHTFYLIWKTGLQWVWSINTGCLLLHDTWSYLWYFHKSVYVHSLICFSYRTYEIEYCSLLLWFLIGK